MKIRGLFLAAALGIVAGTGLTISSAQAVTAPKPGSEQYELLQYYKDFINSMPGCCSMSDGRGDFEEIIETRVDANGNEYNHYKVVIDPEAWGVEGEPLTIDIPDDRVLSTEDAQEACEDVVKMNPANHTCHRPLFNVVWARPSSYGGNTGAGWHVYCYIPKASQLGSLTPANQNETRLASAEQQAPVQVAQLAP